MAEIFNPAPGKKEEPITVSIPVPKSVDHGFAEWAESLSRDKGELMAEGLGWILSQRTRPQPKKRGPKPKTAAKS